jgi:hypothetical protein
MRKAAADEIEKLLAFLDSLDDDPDVEHNGDEIDASYPESGTRLYQSICEDDEPSGDESEPSLGSRESSPNGCDVGVLLEHKIQGYPPSISATPTGAQDRWSAGNTDDREGEHDGCEPDDDLEPSLGWGPNGEKDGDGDREDDGGGASRFAVAQARDRWKAGSRYVDKVGEARRALVGRRFGKSRSGQMIDAGGGRLVPIAGTVR